MTADTQLQQLILNYHKAHQAHDADALRACHADTYIRWLGSSSDDPTDWIPEAYCTSDDMAKWGKDSHVNSSACRQICFAARTEQGWRLAGMYWRDAS